MTDSSVKARNYGERPVQESDPLMELSRIMSFDDLATPSPSNHDRADADSELALDLERELVGGFLDRQSPNDAYQDNRALNSGYPRAATGAPQAAPRRVDPYSVGNDGASASGNDFDPTIYQPAIEPYDATYNAQPYGAASAEEQPQVSLEDELENLLFGDAEQQGSYYSTPQPEARADAYRPAMMAQERAPSSQYPYYQRQHQVQDEASLADAVAADEFDENALQDFMELDSAPLPEANSAEASFALDDMLFDETDFEVEKTDDFELSPVTKPAPHDAVALDDLNLLDDFETNIAAQPDAAHPEQDAFDWHSTYAEEPPLFTAADTHSAEQADDFFLAQDLDFALDDEVVAEPESARTSAAAAPFYAHASSETGARTAPFPHYAGQRSAFATPAPDVETMSVSEGKVEQTHALDLPEVAYHDATDNAGLNDLEAEFAEVFSSIGVEEPAPVQEENAADRAFEDIFRDNYAGYGAAAVGVAAAGVAASGYAPRQASSNAASAVNDTANADDYYNHWAAQDDSAAQAYETQNFEDNGYHGAQGDDLSAASAAYRDKPVRGRRGLLWATVAGVLVLLGGVGYHFIGGGSGSNGPVVIHADTQPIKMQPENPGGTTVPNQDKAVYDRVAGTIPDNPEQKSLVTSSDEPVDLAASGEEDGGFDDDTGTSAPSTVSGASNAPAEPAPLIVPRQVQTMIVRADGTIVQQNAAPAVDMPAVPSAPEASPLTPATPERVAPEPAATAPVAQPVAKVPVRVVPTETHTPAPAAKAPVVVPSRPADQPLTIVGTVEPKKPAAVAAAPAAAPATPGGYVIQIASQPTAEAAQKSYASMAQKYASVIGGRGVDIRKADVPGKGTYYRVRVTAGSKEDATALCTRLKSAGGGCFVTQ